MTPDPVIVAAAAAVVVVVAAVEAAALSRRGRRAGRWTWSDLAAWTLRHPWLGPAALGAAVGLVWHFATHDLGGEHG